VVVVAVATNFAAPLQKIAHGFEAETGHVVQTSAGATGKFHAQIRAGAPFDVLLAADEETPRKLEDEGLAVKGQRFTYARGRLVLWSARAGVVDDQGEVLRKPASGRLAVANPKLAPYGAAAIETLTRLGLKDQFANRLVQGENIAQAFQFVSTGNAELGFVALSQVMSPDRPASGSWWVVPSSLHAPLRQDAVLLQRGESNPAARAFLSHLKGDKARALMRTYGYEF
jgi:molybdate transport system substrate-binding protein